jgi:VWFA-related protein
MMSYAGFSLRWLAALTITGAPLCAQTPPPPTSAASTIKVEVRVVLLDVVVINDKGDPVSGLFKDQFEVMEDGARQTISLFEEHGRTGPAQPAAAGLEPRQAQTSALEPLPANFYTNSQTIKASDSVNVLLLDWLNTQPSDQTYVRKQVIKYLHSVPPGTRLAIFTLGTELRLVQGFTTESSVILAALNNKEAGASPKSVGLLDSKTREASEQEVIEMLIRSDAAPATVSAVRDSMNEAAVRQTGDRVKLTIQGLLELQRYLAPIPGRKNVFWFSGSFPISNVPVPGAGANYSNDFQSTAQRAGPARIAIYPISAEGVMTAGSVLMDPSQGLTTRARAMDLNSGGNVGDSAKQIAMESIARETGGQAFYNTNGLDREITRAVAEGEHYYTMTYTPMNAARDGKFRNIHVKLSNGNYRLSYRRGYFSEGGQEQATTPGPQNTLLELMRFGMPDFDQIAYNVHVTAEDPQPPSGRVWAGVNRDLKGPVTRYRVDFSIPLSELKLTGDTSGTMRGAVQLMLVAYQKNGYPLNLVESKNEFSLKREVYESARNVNIHARQELDVPAGDVYLRVGLFEQVSGHVGTIEIPLLAAAVPSKN